MMRYPSLSCFLASRRCRRPWPGVLLLLSLGFVAMPPMAVSHPAPPGELVVEGSVTPVRLPDLRQWPAGPQRKDAFLEVLVPVVEAENARLAARREWLMALDEREGPMTASERQRLAALCEAYALDCVPGRVDAALLKRVAPIPVEMVAVQAVEESGWGTSRLARQHNNLFGMRTRSGRYQSFDSVEEAVRAYLKNLNTHGAYAELRARRAQLADQGKVRPEALIATLDEYAARADYPDVLLALLRTNAERIRRHAGGAPA